MMSLFNLILHRRSWRSIPTWCPLPLLVTHLSNPQQGQLQVYMHLKWRVLLGRISLYIQTWIEKKSSTSCGQVEALWSFFFSAELEIICTAGGSCLSVWFVPGATHSRATLTKCTAKPQSWRIAMFLENVRNRARRGKCVRRIQCAEWEKRRGEKKIIICEWRQRRLREWATQPL